MRSFNRKLRESKKKRKHRKRCIKLQETRRNSARIEYQDAFDANAARNINTLPERSREELPLRRDNVVQLTEKQLRKARNAGINPLRSILSVISVAVVFALLAFYVRVLASLASEHPYHCLVEYVLGGVHRCD